MDSQDLQRLKNKYDIIGNDAALNRALETAITIAPTDLTVLVSGESGVGKELPVLPLIFCALGLTIAGVILGIKDEKAEKPARDENLLRDLGSIRERAVHQDADQKTRILRTAVLVIALILIILGILNGGLEDVLAKGAAICTECVGLG